MTKTGNTERLRSFGRSYTKRFSLLDPNPYHQTLSLLQSRIIFEISARGEMPASELVELLQLDKGYLSRSIGQMLKKRVLSSRENPADKRAKLLSLTARGETLFRAIDEASRKRSAEFLEKLEPSTQTDLVQHLTTAQILMGEDPLRSSDVRLRSLQPGDLGWVIGRHGEIYNREFGWDSDFEILVGEIAIAFAKKNDPSRERAWIAEARGMRVGCVFLVRDTLHSAKLRILLVDPAARGLGVGSLLVRECIRFARRANYSKLTLWTNKNLLSARKIYVAEGFKLVSEEPHKSFGKNLIGQYWSLDLKTEAL